MACSCVVLLSFLLLINYVEEPKFDCLCHFIKALGEDKNYGPLHGVPNIREDLIGNQMEVLEFIFVKIRDTL